MKIWLLKTENLMYDAYDGWVLWARTEHEARILACKQGGDNSEIWLNADLSTCIPIVDAPISPTPILGSFNAG